MEIYKSLVIIYVLLIAINLIYGIRYSKNLISVTVGDRDITIDFGIFLTMILLVFLAFLAIRDNDNPDYINYFNLYLDPDISNEVGYAVLEKIAKSIGLNYTWFRGSVICCSFLFIWIGINRIDTNRNLIFALYAIFPFVFDAIQLRNLLASSIVIMVLPSLLSGRKKDIIKYVLGVFVATSIHVLAIVYIIFIFVPFREESILKKRFIQLLFVCSIIFVILCRLSSKLYNFLVVQLYSYAGEFRAAHYTRSKVNLGFLIYIVLELLYIIVAYLTKRNIKNKANCNMINGEQEIGDGCYDSVNFILYLNMALSCYFPLFLLNTLFYRIYRNMALINYTLFYTIIKKNSNLENERRLITLFILAFLINVFWIYYADEGSNFYVFFN